jgi:hypothetical protein
VAHAKNHNPSGVLPSNREFRQIREQFQSFRMSENVSGRGFSKSPRPAVLGRANTRNAGFFNDMELRPAELFGWPNTGRISLAPLFLG